MISGIIYRQPLPVAALPQIGEETGTILVKMQKSSAFDVEYPRPFLDEGAPRREACSTSRQACRAPALVLRRKHKIHPDGNGTGPDKSGQTNPATPAKAGAPITEIDPGLRRDGEEGDVRGEEVQGTG